MEAMGIACNWQHNALLAVMFTYMLTLAYVAAFAVFQLTNFLMALAS